MSGIKAPIVDVINKLKTLQLPNNAGNSPNLYSAVWNEQLQRLEEGESYPFNLPAAFVELLMSNNYQQLGAGITASDLTFRIHLAMEQIDAGDGDRNDEGQQVQHCRLLLGEQPREDVLQVLR